MSGRRVTIAVVMLAGLAAPSLADPWRAGVAVAVEHVTSKGAGPTLGATGFGVALRGERRLRGRWHGALIVHADVTGPVTVASTSIEDSGLALLGAALGVTADLDERWQVRLSLGTARLFYLSPRVIGDDGWDLAASVEVARGLWTRSRWNLAAVAQLRVVAGDGDETRTTVVPGIALELGFGR